ncbi:MAG: AsmA family protein [Azonexus sp.]|jgi:AsmA protein|nr:AsmA family protein [Azonexus sp.]
MKILRRLAFVAGGLLLLLGIGVAALFALFDENKIKAQLTEKVYASTQRKLTIDGGLALSVWPDVGVRVGQLTLTERNSDKPFATVGSARLAVAVLPLLSRRVEVRRIEVDGLVLNLLKKKDGSLNIDDLAGDKKAPEGADKPAASSPLQIDVAGVELRNARLTWRDEMANTTTTISDLDFASGRLVGDMATRHFRIEKLTLATTGSSGTDKFELKLAAPLLSLEGEALESKAVDLTARLSGTGRAVEARLGFAGIAGSAKALKVADFRFELDAKSGDATIKAQLASPVAVDSEARVIALDKLTGAIDVANPKLPMKQLKLPLSGQLRTDLTQQTADLKLATAFDESKIGLQAKVSKFAPLGLEFALDIDRLNLDKYLPPAPAGAEKPAAKPAGGEAKIDLAALKTLNLKGSINIGQLTAHRIDVTRLSARIAAAGGHLDIAPLSAGLYGGSMTGSIGINANSNQFAIRQNLADIQIAPLLKDLMDKDPLEGRGSVSVDVTTRGDTVPALKKALAGQAALNLRDGAVKGINIAKSLRELQGVLGAQKKTTVAASGSEKTDFSELSASFRIAGGVAHNDDLQMKSPLLRLTGNGDIDIGNDQVDYLAKISVVNTTTGQQGKELTNLKGVTVPLRMRGPYTQISYALELGSVVEDVVKEKLKEKAKEQLGDSLKGLLGR